MISSKLKIRPKTAVTMTELALVVITIGVMVAFGVPQYQNVVKETRQKTAKLNLNFIKTAQEIYFDENGFYYPKDASENSIGVINTNLKLAITADTSTYSCSAGGGDFNCQASETGWSCHITKSLAEATCP
jgi:type II secretory pathway pseudopilin PulG